MAPPSGPAGAQSQAFADWLKATMHSRGLSQAQLARVVGVADTQVSRWRRGQVVPTVRYLQRIAETLDVPRVSLDRLAGYPVALAGAGQDAGDAPQDADPQRQAELHAYGAALRLLLEQRVPRPLWPAFAAACAALAGSMDGAYRAALAQAEGASPDAPGAPGAPDAPPEAPAVPARPAGFRR